MSHWQRWHTAYDDPTSSLSRRLAVVREQVATLVELDPVLAERARATAADLGLSRVEVRTADAGVTSTYDDLGPLDLVLACGVFGNVVDGDVETTVGWLPTVLRPGATVGTRAARVPRDPTEVGGDPAEWVRSVLAEAGFAEEAFVAPGEAGFRVGVHRWPVPTLTGRTGERLFTLVDRA